MGKAQAKGRWIKHCRQEFEDKAPEYENLIYDALSKRLGHATRYHYMCPNGIDCFVQIYFLDVKVGVEFVRSVNEERDRAIRKKGVILIKFPLSALDGMDGYARVIRRVTCRVLAKRGNIRCSDCLFHYNYTEIDNVDRCQKRNGQPIDVNARACEDFEKSDKVREPAPIEKKPVLHEKTEKRQEKPSVQIPHICKCCFTSSHVKIGWYCKSKKKMVDPYDKCDEFDRTRKVRMVPKDTPDSPRPARGPRPGRGMGSN